MKKKSLFISVVYIFLLVSGSVHGIGESAIVLGGDASWKLAEYRAGVTEITSVRPNPALVLSSRTGSSASGYTAAAGVLGNFRALQEPALDLSISFDESNTAFYRDNIGNYRVSAPAEIEAADRRYARAGEGAALFNGRGPVIAAPESGNALFAPGRRIGDFTIEFWLYPLNMENGERILSWSGAAGAGYAAQRIVCASSRNRLQWSFENFFTSSSGFQRKNIVFSGNAPIIPKTWSHHLLRFDASTGMIEYIVNGEGEAIEYATSSGRENGEVFTPIAAAGGAFLLCERFMGLMDEFKIHRVCAGRSVLQKYISAGGRVETRAIDLGQNNSGVVRVDAKGGRVSIRGNAANNEYRENGRFRFSDDAEMSFFIRASENPYLLNESSWVNFTPGEIISGVHGRYAQIAVDFYPSEDGETSPYLEQLRVIFTPGEPPLPPSNLSAVAVDGGVLLRWKHSPNADTAGYLVYYSSVRGEYFGGDAKLGSSPIDAGNSNSLFIEGLKNGALYYFRVASYNRDIGPANLNAGEFSREVTARPLAGLRLSDILE